MIPKDSHRRNPFSVRMTAGLMPALALAFLCLWNSSAAARGNSRAISHIAE